MFKRNEYFAGKANSLALQTAGEHFDTPGDSAFDMRALVSACFCLYD